MTQRTYTTTPVREVALAAACAVANADRATRVPPLPPLTADEYWRARVDDVLDSYGREHQTTIAGQAVQAFLAAPSQAQGQLLGILGLTDYGALPAEALARVLATVGLMNFLAISTDDQNRCFTLARLGV